MCDSGDRGRPAAAAAAGGDGELGGVFVERGVLAQLIALEATVNFEELPG
ncbi:hypothetical protein [Actinoplanes sp. NPDC051859]